VQVKRLVAGPAQLAAAAVPATVPAPVAARQDVPGQPGPPPLADVGPLLDEAFGPEPG